MNWWRWALVIAAAIVVLAMLGRMARGALNTPPERDE